MTNRLNDYIRLFLTVGSERNLSTLSTNNAANSLKYEAGKSQIKKSENEVGSVNRSYSSLLLIADIFTNSKGIGFLGKYQVN